MGKLSGEPVTPLYPVAGERERERERKRETFEEVLKEEEERLETFSGCDIY